MNYCQAYINMSITWSLAEHHRTDKLVKVVVS